MTTTIFFTNLLPFFEYDACLGYQHSCPACVNSIINERMRKFDVLLYANKLVIKYS